jgi:hypothetical protein
VGMNQPADQNHLGDQPTANLPVANSTQTVSTAQYPDLPAGMLQTPNLADTQTAGIQAQVPDTRGYGQGMQASEPASRTPVDGGETGQPAHQTAQTADAQQMDTLQTQGDHQQLYTAPANGQQQTQPTSAYDQQQQDQVSDTLQVDGTVKQFGGVSAGDKERIEFGGSQTEHVPLVELKDDQEIEPEVEGWLEKLEKGEDIHLPQPLTDDQGQVVMADAGAQVAQERIILPMSEAELDAGLKAKVTQSARWLAVWCQRIIKKMGDQTAFRNTEI